MKDLIESLKLFAAAGKIRFAGSKLVRTGSYLCLINVAILASVLLAIKNNETPDPRYAFHSRAAIDAHQKDGTELGAYIIKLPVTLTPIGEGQPFETAITVENEAVNVLAGMGTAVQCTLNVGTEKRQWNGREIMGNTFAFVASSDQKEATA